MFPPRPLALSGLCSVSLVALQKHRVFSSNVSTGQNPYAGAARGVVEKVLVVCPVSLVNVILLPLPSTLKRSQTSLHRIGKPNFINGWDVTVSALLLATRIKKLL